MRPLIFRRGFMCFLAACVTQFVCGAHAAQSYPSKPVRLIVGAAPGGPTDAVARNITPKLSEYLGRPVVVDNRGGAGGMIATDLVAKSAPDGYTLAMVFISHAVNPTLVRKLPYDTLNDFAPISLVGYQALLLVAHPSLGITSVKELISLARARPGKLNYASGNGNASHLAAELFKYTTKTNIVHVPYKGGQAPALVDTLSGQIPFMFDPVITSLQYVKAGRLKAIAVTSAQRSPLAPQVPTMAESGLPGFEVTAWYGVVAPAKTPKEVIARLSKEIVRVLETPDVNQRLLTMGTEIVGSTPDEFDAHVRREIAKWEKLLRAAGITGLE